MVSAREKTAIWKQILIAFILVLASQAIAQAPLEATDDVGVQDGSKASRPTTLPDLTTAQATAPLHIQGALTACFKAEHASDPDMPGQVVLSYTITEEGMAVDITLEPIAVRGRPVVSCVQEAMAKLRWPRVTGAMKQVRVPLGRGRRQRHPTLRLQHRRGPRRGVRSEKASNVSALRTRAPSGRKRAQRGLGKTTASRSSEISMESQA